MTLRSPSLLRGISISGSSVALVGLSWVLAAPATAQRIDTRLCSTGAQACSVSPATAILSDGPLSISTSEGTQMGANTTQEAIFKNVADSVNEQATAENTATGIDLGPLEITPGTPSIGVRDVQD